jgi:phospholipase/carboxylesterase
VDNNGSALEWQPGRGARAEWLFLLFHGVGATPADLVRLGKRLAREYPEALLLSLAAPDPFDGGGDGRQWFSTSGITEANRPARVAAALPRFVQTVRALQARHALAWPRTTLVGFSQGAVMALEAVQAQARLAGRVIAFAGRHATPPRHAPRDTVVQFLHGRDDRVVLPRLAIEAAERLVALGGDATLDVLPGIGHELHPQLIERAIERVRCVAL